MWSIQEGKHEQTLGVMAEARAEESWERDEQMVEE
jgi:hypothetical protein